MSIKRFAAIDIGSFEVELGIYELGKSIGSRRLEHVRYEIGLGKETYKTGKISAALSDELCRVLRDFCRIMKTYRVEAYRAYATSALREAENSLIVLDKIHVLTGLKVSIISNSEQRFLSLKAIAAKGADFAGMIRDATIIADSSYGSLQLTVYHKGAMMHTQNLLLGVLRLRELILSIDIPGEERGAVLSELVDKELFAYQRIYLKEEKIKHLVAIGDPVASFLECLLGDVKDSYIRREDFLEAFEKIRDIPTARLEEVLGIGRGLAHILLPCGVIYCRLMEIFSIEGIYLPRILLIDGIAAEYGIDHSLIRVNHDFNQDIVHAAKQMAKKYRVRDWQHHALPVYALGIFDGLKKLHGLPARDRLLLEIAAIVYHCGSFISMKNARVCGYDIISAAEIIGLSHDERMLIAEIIRDGSHAYGYTGSFVRAAKLGAILGLANALAASGKDNSYSFRLDNDRFLIHRAPRCCGS